MHKTSQQLQQKTLIILESLSESKVQYIPNINKLAVISYRQVMGDN